MAIDAVIVAAGSATRFGDGDKLTADLCGRPVLAWSLAAFEAVENVGSLVLVTSRDRMEAATSIAEQPGTTVTLSYRSEAFGRAKAKNREKLASQSASGRLRVMLKSTVKGIGEHDLELKTDSGIERMPNDAVIICAGGILPTEFLKAAGIVMDTKYGTA